MPLKTRKNSSGQIWLDRFSNKSSSQLGVTDQHLVNRTNVDRPLSQREVDENFMYLEETKQPLDKDLTGVAALDTFGIIVRRAEGDIHTRTIIGQTNRIVVTDGGGINQDPVITIGSDIVTLNDSQTLTNKTIDGRLNNLIYINADTLDGYHAIDLPLDFKVQYWGTAPVDGTADSNGRPLTSPEAIKVTMNILNGAIVRYVFGWNSPCGCTCTNVCVCQYPCDCQTPQDTHCYIG